MKKDLAETVANLTVEVNATQKMLASIITRIGGNLDEYSELINEFRGQEWEKIASQDKGFAAKASNDGIFD